MVVADAAPAVNPTSSATVTRLVPHSGATTADTLRRLGIHTPGTLDTLCVHESKKQFLVQGLISAGSVGIAVGDSGIGKTPLIYQLALCVAAGIPWLGMPTSGGQVLYLDCENGALNSRDVRDSLSRHLGLLQCPENFLSSYDISDVKHLSPAVDAVKPALVVIDTLRSFDSSAEENNTKAGAFIKSLRELGQKNRTAFLLIHHVKKQEGGFFNSANIETGSLIQWLNQACGARSLINQTDFRVGVDVTAKSNASLIMRAHVRVRGEMGPFYLERVLDEDQQPVGYRRLEGLEFLDNKDQQAAFEKLPAAFSFKEAKSIYGRQDQATNDFLAKCLLLGVLHKPSRGRYEKVPAQASGVGGV
jgi:hypothetical protein